MQKSHFGPFLPSGFIFWRFSFSELKIVTFQGFSEKIAENRSKVENGQKEISTANKLDNNDKNEDLTNEPF